uniref:Methyltransferase domain-containing protein n=1 Tax=Mucochytrium quahogii TaxID=96639 RepID=A0A7S2SFH5_9STRA|mmetsp:Transcript_13452/g.21975  ORF Transcript_13452/g.21975 Transcript_13452/m.21975 type:complete len:300 (+) Transcript_13452:103-1002(+)
MSDQTSCGGDAGSSTREVIQVYKEYAKEYEKEKTRPWRIYMERYSMMNTILSQNPTGLDLSGKKVLDLACGEGIYSRMTAQMGADKVIGVDISQEMLDIASSHPSCSSSVALSTLEYRLGNCMSLDAMKCTLSDMQEGSFDIIICSWLFCNAKSTAEFSGFAEVIGFYLQPHTGFFLGTDNYSLADNTLGGDYYAHTHGFYKKLPEDMTVPAGKIDIHLFNPDVDKEGDMEIVMSLSNYHYPVETMARLFEQYELELSTPVRPLEVDMSIPEEDKKQFDDLVQSPSFALLQGRKKRACP